LERLVVELTFPPEQTCYGQPVFNDGFEDRLRPVVLNFMCAFSKNDLFDNFLDWQGKLLQRSQWARTIKM